MSTGSPQPRNLEHRPEGKGWLLLVVVLLAFAASCWYTLLGHHHAVRAAPAKGSRAEGDEP